MRKSIFFPLKGSVLRSLGLIAILWMAFVPSASASYLVGVGKADITGVLLDTGMAGYVNEKQVSSGLHTRLWARAFVIVESETKKRVLIVNTDLWSMTQPVKREVIRQLREKYNKTYSYDNVMLIGTHSHAGLSGFDSYVIYNLTTYGFRKDVFSDVVGGIVEAIELAHNSLVSAKIYHGESELNGASVNRSAEAYELNSDKSNYHSNVDRSMELLKFVTRDGRDIGLLNWFAGHPTSLGPDSLLVSGDNKGVAAHLFERHMQEENPNFVAGFANANLGDVSPLVAEAELGLKKFERSPAEGVDKNRGDVARTRLSGERQYRHAYGLYESARNRIRGPIDYQHGWIHMPTMTVGEESLCHPAFGLTFPTGAEDGPSDLEGFYEGMTLEGGKLREITEAVKKFMDSFNGTVTNFLNVILNKKPIQNSDPCQFPKPVAVTGKENKGMPMVLPFQILRLGKLAIVALPAEVTTMTGRRIRNEVAEVLQNSGVEKVILSSIANAYGGYITTKEEFAAQHYEGASTYYGPNTGQAFQDIFSGLASRLVGESTEVPFLDEVGAEPHYFKPPKGGLIQDIKSKKPRKDKAAAGQVLRQPEVDEENSMVTMSLHFPTPRGFDRGAFFFLQVNEDGEWRDLFTENDPELTLFWTQVRVREESDKGAEEDFALASKRLEMDVQLRQADQLPRGEYRFRWKGRMMNSQKKVFEGSSESFEL